MCNLVARESCVPRVHKDDTPNLRQFFQALNQLDRLQRLRKGDNVPAPLNLEILGDTTPTMRNEQK